MSDISQRVESCKDLDTPLDLATRKVRVMLS